MKKLSELIKNVETLEVVGDTDKNISSIGFDSRTMEPESLFVAIQGTLDDGTKFISDAIQKGSIVIVHEVEMAQKNLNITYIRVSDSRKTLAQIAQDFYDNPSQKLKLVGVTGTNGKTTTATLLFNLFRSLGFHTALLSTIENKIDDEVIPATHTTPDPVVLAEFLSKAVSRGCTHAFMECSSHAIHQKRVDGLHFAGAIFTNLTHDHLNYHKTLDAYADAKKELFDNLSTTSFALANSDDPKATYMMSGTNAHVYYFGLENREKVDFNIKILKHSLEGLTLSINEKIVNTKLIGGFNAQNIAGIYITTKLLGISEETIVEALSTLEAPAGRLEFIKSNLGVYGVVDYAHTPDALENVLKTLRQVVPETSQIITVVGCGGNRDKTKRAIMAQIVCKLSDKVVFTSDNPRNEDPKSILDDMVVAVSDSYTQYECIIDRHVAITRACEYAKPGDVILVAGKGHENYQIFSDSTRHFSDKKELEKNFKK